MKEYWPLIGFGDMILAFYWLSKAVRKLYSMLTYIKIKVISMSDDLQGQPGATSDHNTSITLISCRYRDVHCTITLISCRYRDVQEKERASDRQSVPTLALCGHPAGRVRRGLVLQRPRQEEELLLQVGI